MTLEQLSLLYLGLSVVLFLYALRTKFSAMYSPIYAIAMNIIPLVTFGYLGNEETRILRIPIAYFPFVAATLAIAYRYRKGLLQKRYLDLIALYILLIAYLPIQTFLLAEADNWISFLQYYLLWVFNLGFLFTLSWAIMRAPKAQTIKLVRWMVLVVSAGALLGILRNLYGLEQGENFMPLMNRNGTISLLVMIWPLLLMCKDLNLLKGAMISYSALISILFCILLIGSRMGILGALAASCLYFWFKQPAGTPRLIRGVLAALLISIVAGGLILSPLGDVALPRLQRTLITASDFISNPETITPGAGDYRRSQYILYAIELTRRNFIWGTGVGLENYRDKMDRIDPTPAGQSKAHSFYLSYLAEFGFIGYTIFLLIFLGIWRHLKVSPPFLNSRSIIVVAGFRAMFGSVLFMLTMNEYITYPATWILISMGLGICAKLEHRSVVRTP